jgi:hypothetical protein
MAFTYEAKLQLFLTSIDNAIKTNLDIPVGLALNREASKHIGNGLKLVVHSNDHDRHFHIEHRETGNNARFSFPKIEFIDYKTSGKPFSAKQIRNIISTCYAYETFIKETLDRRST